MNRLGIVTCTSSPVVSIIGRSSAANMDDSDDSLPHSPVSERDGADAEGAQEATVFAAAPNKGGAIPSDENGRRKLLRTLLRTLPRDVVRAEVDEWVRIDSGATGGGPWVMVLDAAQVSPPHSLDTITSVHKR